MSRKDEYNKARRNLQRRISNLEKQGFTYMEDIPAIPKRITQSSINRLNKMNRENLLKAGAVIDTESGELITSLKQYREVRNYNRARDLFTQEHGFSPEDYGASYNAESNTFSIPKINTEDYGVYEDVVIEKLGEVTELVQQINSSVLSQDWENFLAGRSEEQAIQQLQDEGILDEIQEALQFAYEYKNKNDGDDVGNNYMAGRAITEACRLLRGTSAPLTAQEMQDIANAGYAQ